MACHYLDLAESALHAPSAEFDGVEFSPDLARKTAVRTSRLIGSHPRPDGNKRVAYLCAVEFVVRNGRIWTSPADDLEADETVAMFAGLAARSIGEDQLTAWIAEGLK